MLKPKHDLGSRDRGSYGAFSLAELPLTLTPSAEAQVCSSKDQLDQMILTVG